VTLRQAEPASGAPPASNPSPGTTPAATPGWRFNETLIQGVCDGFAAAGIDFVVYVPDSSLDGVEQRLIELGTIETYSVVREDDGIAMAIGAYMVGRSPAVLMEGAGVGMCATVLARALVSRTPMLVLAGHSETLGEKFDYHSTARLVVASVPRALNIPNYVIPRAEEAHEAVVQACLTVRGQKSPFVLMVPPYVFRAG
jgi:sulfopyruvate decarboxylase TPP-binding subunit